MIRSKEMREDVESDAACEAWTVPMPDFACLGACELYMDDSVAIVRAGL